jgi:hypothetical protein
MIYESTGEIATKYFQGFKEVLSDTFWKIN